VIDFLFFASDDGGANNTDDEAINVSRICGR
jgi:hypothetical protein